MNEQAKEEFSEEEWAFPDVEGFEDFSMFIDEEGEIKPPVDPLQNEKDSYVALTTEMEKTREEYVKKNLLLDKALERIENYMTEIDDDFTEILTDVIQTVATKLIYQEIKTDPALIKKIITQLKKLVQEKKGVVHVYLSEEDFNSLTKDKTKSSTILNIDPALSCGDVILKTKTTEIRALLQERIEKLMS